MARPIKRIEDKFWSRVMTIPEHACWEWTGSLCVGYGKISHCGRHLLAHRVSWELNCGPIPEGLWVLHTCDNPSCVNPDHLFIGSSRDNINDMVNKGRQSMGSRNGNSKITEDAARSILGMLVDGMPQRAIAKIHGVSQATVWEIKEKRTWRHV